MVNFVSLLEDMDKEEVKPVSKPKEEPLKSTPTRTLRLETEEDTRSITTGITADYSLKLHNESTIKDGGRRDVDGTVNGIVKLKLSYEPVFISTW